MPANSANTRMLFCTHAHVHEPPKQTNACGHMPMNGGERWWCSACKAINNVFINSSCLRHSWPKGQKQEQYITNQQCLIKFNRVREKRVMFTCRLVFATNKSHPFVLLLMVRYDRNLRKKKSLRLIKEQARHLAIFPTFPTRQVWNLSANWCCALSCIALHCTAQIRNIKAGDRILLVELHRLFFARVITVGKHAYASYTNGCQAR